MLEKGTAVGENMDLSAQCFPVTPNDDADL